MPNNNPTKEMHPIEVLMRRVAEEPPITPEEIAANKAEEERLREKLERDYKENGPTMYESAYMFDDGVILIGRRTNIPTDPTDADIIVKDLSESYKPGDERYEEIRKRYGNLEPDQGSTIIKKLVDDKWVDVGSTPMRT